LTDRLKLALNQDSYGEQGFRTFLQNIPVHAQTCFAYCAPPFVLDDQQ